MAKPRVLVSTPLGFGDPCPILTMLEAPGFDVEVRPGKAPWPDEDTREKLAGVDAILAGGEYFNDHTLVNADRLKIVARNGVGYDRVNVDVCTARGILVTNTPGAMSDSVADETMAFILALVRRIPEGDRTVKAGGYAVDRGQDLAVMTLGLVGCGNIGVEVVRRALSFKMRVLVCDPWVDDAAIQALGASPASMDELLSQSDVVSLHTPLTPDTEGMVNADFLGQMKTGSYLINAARGEVVDEGALIDALQNGPLAGAGLDCQATEPPEGISLELARLDNVIAMPHAASNTWAARERMARWAAQSIIDWLEGRVPEHVVNREVLK